MVETILYTTGCPRCRVLESKLEAAKIPYHKETSVETMQALGLTEAPSLLVEGKKLLGFLDAVQWVNRLK